MAQWDVYPNPSARLREEIPYLVDLQSELLSALGSRLVAPLARTRIALTKLPGRLCPGFVVDGVRVVLLPHEAGPIDSRLLKHRVVSLRNRSHEIVDAIDAVMSGL